MKIGVPKEIKPQEHRIGLTPDSVKILTSNGNQVFIEKDGGFEAGFDDEQYKKVGAKIKVTKDEVHIIGNKKVKRVNIKTAPYPGFPTDLQAQMMVLLCKANKQSIIKEEIFENRFMHVAELNRMGAKISTDGSKAKVSGNINFAAAELMATDLRASVSLILAALTAKGKSVINRIYHLDRGYENIEKKLKKVGAKIRRVS